MACRADIKKAVLDVIFSELTEGRHTFTRISEDTVQVNNVDDNLKTKAGSKGQAVHIANNLKDRAKKMVDEAKVSFNGQIRATINQYSVYDPVTITFEVSPAYIDHEYNKLSDNNKTDPGEATKTVSLDSVSKLLDERIKEGGLGVFASLPKESVIKMIAEQAQNITRGVRYEEAIDNSNSYQSTVNQFGKPLVDAAIQLYPHSSILLAIAEEQDEVNSNTGPSTHDELNETPFETDPTVGYFTRYLDFKKRLLKNAEEKLNDVNKALNDPRISTEDKVALNGQKRELTHEIEGIDTKIVKKKGLKQEINELSSAANTLAVSYYVERDLERLDKLIISNDIANIKDAKDIIDFYELAGNFTKSKKLPNRNPFFLESDIYKVENGKVTDDFFLDKATMDKFKEWSDRASSKRVEVEKKLEEIMVSKINSNPAVKKTYKDDKIFKIKGLGISEITSAETGLGDTDVASMWIMDITQGIFSKNGIIPQVMFSELSNLFNAELAGSNVIRQMTDELNPKVIKRLHELNRTLKGMGILSGNGNTYQIFKEITKDGFETGRFVMKFNKEFYDEHSSIIDEFWDTKNKSEAITDDEIRGEIQKAAYAKQREWRRKNTIVMDLGAIPEIINDEDNEFIEFNSYFNSVKAPKHREELVALLGEKEYNRQVEEQKELLRKYTADRANLIATIMQKENVTDPTALSNGAWDSINSWEKRLSPFHGVGDFNKVIFDKHIDNFGKYNLFIPRRFEATVAKDTGGYNYTFTDSTKATGYYNETYEKYIENDEVLGQFHDLLLQSNQFIRERLDYDQQKAFSANSLPSLMKTFSETLADRADNTGILARVFEAFRNLWEGFRLSFGVKAQSDQSYTTENPTTGKKEYKVNDDFIKNNKTAIYQRSLIERIRFNQALTNKIDINQHTKMPLSMLSPSALLLVAEYLNIDLTVEEAKSGRIDALRKETGDIVNIGRIIGDFSMHTIVQAYSFDLAKLIKNGTYVAAIYNARTKALPVLEVMKNFYDAIKIPNTNNISKQLFNVPKKKLETEGEREHAKKQMEEWFQRVVLGNYGLKHKGVLREKPIYSSEEKQKIKDINELMSKEKNEKIIAQLAEVKRGFGKTATLTAVFDNALAFIRTMRLGFNFSSGITNYMEGWLSNMLVAATGEYFDPNEIYYGYKVTYHSFIKNASWGAKWGESKLAKKNRLLMDKYRVLMETANELQKNSIKTFSDKLGWMHPHALNSRVEYMNQSPIMIAMLRTLKIKSIDGNKESSVWDAMDENGIIADEYRREENINNWENMQGEQFTNFRESMADVLVKAHGNYDVMRGMLAKSTTAGKALLMFKSWVPQQLYWRFAREQENILSGNANFKGRYWSYGKGSAFLHGAVVGTALLGPIGGSIIGGGVGLIFGWRGGTDNGHNDIIGVLKETTLSAWIMAKKMLGMPLNTITAVVGKRFIDTSGKEFDAWVGKGKFTQQDANALKSNMTDIGNQLMIIALILVAKGLFWDDKDKPDETERKIHNALVNKLMQLGTQASMYVNPGDVYNSTIGSNAVIKYLTDVGKWTTKLNAYFEGRDIIMSGPNAGKSALWNQTRKTFMPGVFKDVIDEPIKLGLGSLTERQFLPNPFDKYFKSAEKKDEESNKRDRAEMRLGLKSSMKAEYPDEDERDKEILKILNEKLPTPTRLKKLELSRDEYNKALEEEQ